MSTDPVTVGLLWYVNCVLLVVLVGSLIAFDRNEKPALRRRAAWAVILWPLAPVTILATTVYTLWSFGRRIFAATRL